MKSFKPGDIVTIAGTYLLKGEAPTHTVLISGINDGTFVEKYDDSRESERVQRLERGDVFPDLGYKDQTWFLARET